MSSPLAKKSKNLIDRMLILFHRVNSHVSRVDILSEELSNLIKKFDLVNSGRFLDVGCGDLSLSRNISNRFPNVDLISVDLYDLPSDLVFDPQWRNYIKFDGVNLPFPDNYFDVAIFSDVLHHVDADHLIELLLEARRVSKYVLIKDHFEYGFFSRQMLRLMDFVGNYGYGVSIPARYFSASSFEKTLSNSNFTLVHLNVGIDLYERSFVFKTITSRKWQFTAVLKSE